MLVIFLYMEVLLFSNQKVPYKACKVSKPTSYKNAQHQNQLRCWATEAPVLFVSINVFAYNNIYLSLRDSLTELISIYYLLKVKANFAGCKSTWRKQNKYVSGQTCIWAKLRLYLLANSHKICPILGRSIGLFATVFWALSQRGDDHSCIWMRPSQIH